MGFQDVIFNKNTKYTQLLSTAGVVDRLEKVTLEKGFNNLMFTLHKNIAISKCLNN